MMHGRNGARTRAGQGVLRGQGSRLGDPLSRRHPGVHGRDRRTRAAGRRPGARRRLRHGQGGTAAAGRGRARGHGRRRGSDAADAAGGGGARPPGARRADRGGQRTAAARARRLRRGPRLGPGAPSARSGGGAAGVGPGHPTGRTARPLPSASAGPRSPPATGTSCATTTSGRSRTWGACSAPRAGSCCCSTTPTRATSPWPPGRTDRRRYGTGVGRARSRPHVRMRGIGAGQRHGDGHPCGRRVREPVAHLARGARPVAGAVVAAQAGGVEAQSRGEDGGQGAPARVVPLPRGGELRSGVRERAAAARADVHARRRRATSSTTPCTAGRRSGSAGFGPWDEGTSPTRSGPSGFRGSATSRRGGYRLVRVRRTKA